MQNQIHTRDLIVGLQKGLALIQLFSKEFPRLTVPQAAKMSGLTQKRRAALFPYPAARALSANRRTSLLANA
ncbi:transcriptional regulator [Klebsiella michiganensis]|uniref:Transcriptional regulator n=1 Tax=Klebsiella michiganensis TaxID=1134687 RepID=A0A7H4N659_9ENTR|nr:transcriptional regulator [Klebsiella michiganensis]